MRIRTDSIVTALVILSLVSGTVGCRSNGGPWYNPKSYTWHNPFKSEETSATPYEMEGSAHAGNQKPSALAQPNVSTPPGGYTSKEAEAQFYAKKDSSPMMVPQYQAGAIGDTNRVASTSTPPATYGNSAYSPYGTPENNTVVPNSGYQPTNFHPEQSVANAAPQSPQGQYSGYQDTSTASYPPASPYGASTSPYATPSTAPAVANNYSPYNAPVQDTASYYGNPQPTYQPQPVQQQPAYQQQPATPVNNYGVPTATPYNVDPAAGFTANPSSYQPSPYQPTTPPSGF